MMSEAIILLIALTTGWVLGGRWRWLAAIAVAGVAAYFAGAWVALLPLVALAITQGWRSRDWPALIRIGLVFAALGLTAGFGATGAVWLPAALVVGRLWRSQRQPAVRGLATVSFAALTVTASVGTGWPQGVAVLALTATALLVERLLHDFFAEQDAVFAVSLDRLMGQYSQEVQELYADMRGWRHDYHDHLQALKAYLDAAELARARHYLDELEDKLDSIDTLVHSGNPVLDAIVNAKLTLAERAEIPSHVKVFVGATPLIADLDLVVIVGNLLDNALEAITAQPAGELRRLRVYIAILKQQLYISVTNTRPAAQAIDPHYASTKNDKRGLGIRRINKLVAKYDGQINRQYEAGVFVTEIAIPLAQAK